MSRRCLTGKGSMVGNRVSHAKNRTKVRLFPNIHVHSIFVPKLDQFVSMKLSTSALRTLTKLGADAFIAKQLDTVEKIFGQRPSFSVKSIDRLNRRTAVEFYSSTK
jgi:large subunit ribosomal protein L28